MLEDHHLGELLVDKGGQARSSEYLVSIGGGGSFESRLCCFWPPEWRDADSIGPDWGGTIAACKRLDFLNF
jgi:hypothetical protein